ncbi:MAG: DNA polymerase III subunit beta [Clostridia bacterium]|nr:DNA polymerase III subunit beta [Clostridia bacterium]
MIFSCDKATLLNGINIASKALPQKSINPICDGILFYARNSEVILTTTDASLTIQTKIAADIKEEGSVVINGKFIGEVIRKMPDGMVKISGDKTGIEVTGNFSKINISALDPDDYPALPVIDKDSFFTLEQGELKKLITQTMFATSMDDARPIFTGCLFDIEEESINVVALDGHRLALRNSFVQDIDEPIKAIIPARALSEITKIISDTEDLARLYIQKSYCMVEIEETKIITRLIDGDFIKYRPLIPTEFKTTLTINRVDLLEAIDRAWLIVRENLRNKYIVFRITDEKLIITSRSDSGKAYEEVDYAGNATPIEIGFNPQYFVDCLKNIEDEFINFSYTTEKGPTVTAPVDGNKFLYLLLPVIL